MGSLIATGAPADRGGLEDAWCPAIEMQYTSDTTIVFDYQYNYRISMSHSG